MTKYWFVDDIALFRIIGLSKLCVVTKELGILAKCDSRYKTGTLQKNQKVLRGQLGKKIKWHDIQMTRCVIRNRKYVLSYTYY